MMWKGPVAMKTLGDVHIAGSLTTVDWKAFRANLKPGGDAALWNKAFNDYFYERLSLRYLGPIKEATIENPSP
jgi:hypothetical protein